MKRLLLGDRLAAEIAAAARHAFPNECCGLIEGVRVDDELRAAALHPARNLAGASDRFEIDPADHIAARKAARANGSSIIGCYHSHPGGAALPSQWDGGGEEGFVWLIAALADAAAAVSLKAFVYLDGDFSELILATGAEWVTSSE